MTQFLNTEHEIKAWLDKYHITDYELVPHEKYGFVVDTHEDVDLHDQGLEVIVVKFNIAHEGFYCSHNQLTSLDFAPISVWNFDCSHNRLTHLVNSPKIVTGSFNCSHNQILSLQDLCLDSVGDFDCAYNLLTSLLGSPRIVRNFKCNHNRLMSLEFCPESVGANFFAISNQIKDLEHFPKKIGLTPYLSNNPALADLQEIKNFQELFKIHCEFMIKKEKNELEQHLKLSVPEHSNKITDRFKI